MAYRFDYEKMEFDAASQGLSASALGRLAKVNPSSAWQFLRGRSNSPSMAKKLAKALGFEVSRYILRDREAVGR